MASHPSFFLIATVYVIAGQWQGDNKMLHAVELLSWLKLFSLTMEIRPGIARSAGKHLTCFSTRASDFGGETLVM